MHNSGKKLDVQLQPLHGAKTASPGQVYPLMEAGLPVGNQKYHFWFCRKKQPSHILVTSSLTAIRIGRVGVIKLAITIYHDDSCYIRGSYKFSFGYL